MCHVLLQYGGRAVNKIEKFSALSELYVLEIVQNKQWAELRVFWSISMLRTLVFS